MFLGIYVIIKLGDNMRSNDESLAKLQHFFAADLKLKKSIFNINPSTCKDYPSSYHIVRYMDDTFLELDYICAELKCISSDFFGDGIIASIENYCSNLMNEFIKCGSDIHKLDTFYKNYISGMNSDFVNSVKKNCFGYSINIFPYDTFEMITSVNELLHFMHSYIVNNDKIYESVAISAEKVNDYGYSIRLRGESNELAEAIFKNFPLSLDVGWTDMISLSNHKMIMMVRDRGHALTIQILKQNDQYRIEYFVPKLCNVDMINRLPGVHKVKPEDPGATGVFETKHLLGDLFTFIENVPTDLDIVSYSSVLAEEKCHKR